MRRMVFCCLVPFAVSAASAQRSDRPAAPQAVGPVSDSVPTVLPTIVGVRKPAGRDTVVVRPLYITAAGPVTVAQPAGEEAADGLENGPVIVEVPVFVPVWPYAGRPGVRHDGHVRARVENRQSVGRVPVLAPPPRLAPAPALPDPPRLPR